MIFAMVGTHEQQFDRMVRMVDNLKTTHDIIIQYGYCRYLPINAKGTKFLSFGSIVNHMKEASVVITHAGTGCVMLALSLGKNPIVIPRYHHYGEHVDDHQLELVKTLADDDLIIPLFDGDCLESCIKKAMNPEGKKRIIRPSDELISELHRIIIKT